MSSNSSSSEACEACKDAFKEVVVHESDTSTEKVKSTWEAQRGKKEVFDHFVTVRGLEGEVVLQAKFGDASCCDKITWVRTDPGTITSPAVDNDKCTAKVARTGQTENNLEVGERIEVHIKCDNIIIWKGVVWVVWANISLEIPEAPNNPVVRDEPAELVQNSDDVADGPGLNLTLSAQQSKQESIRFKCQITPQSMFDSKADVPQMKPGQSVPGDVLLKSVPKGDDKHKLLDKQFKYGVRSDGFASPWDISRQVRSKTLNPATFKKKELITVKGVFWDAFAATPTPAEAVNQEFPEGNQEVASTNPVGNDDVFTGRGETVVPYSDKPEKQGLIYSSDAPNMAMPHAIGANNDTFEVRMHFREFARVYLGGKWYKISNPTANAGLWRVHFAFVKANNAWTKDMMNTKFEQDNEEF